MFSQKLKELRNFENLSQVDFAAEIDFSQAAISAWENGTREPGLEALVRIAQFFNVSVDYLLTDSPRSTYVKNALLIDSIEESELIRIFRSLPKDLKHRATAYMRNLDELISEESATKQKKNA